MESFRIKSLGKVTNSIDKQKLISILNTNNYGRRELKKETVKSEGEKIINGFCSYFKNNNYIQHNPVDINSGIDSSVYYIGSPISVLKSHITNRSIPHNGFFISQPCLRTRNTYTMFDDTKIPERGSYFPGIVGLVNYNNLDQIVENSISYLTDELNIPLEHIHIRASSCDRDLLASLQRLPQAPYIELDTKPEQYYRHTYGMGEIKGRNYNIALRHKDTELFNDIGNIIVIEDSFEKYGVELALGATTIMKELFHLEHVLDASPISSLLPGNELYIKLKDCITSAVALMRTEEKINANNTKGRVFRTYLRGILYFSKKLAISLPELQSIIQQYETLEYSTYTTATQNIITYLLQCEDIISHKNTHLSSEEMVIKNVL